MHGKRVCPNQPPPRFTRLHLQAHGRKRPAPVAGAMPVYCPSANSSPSRSRLPHVYSSPTAPISMARREAPPSGLVHSIIASQRVENGTRKPRRGDGGADGLVDPELLIVLRIGPLVRVEEEELLVGSQRPQLGRHLALGIVAHGAGIHHGFQAEHAGELRLGGRVGGGMQPVQAGLDRSAGRLDVGRVLRVELGIEDRREDVLLHHVNHGARLHLHEANVVVQEHLGARLALLLVEHTQLLEEGNVLRVGEAEDGLDARVDAPDAALVGLNGP
mmetsp:Transcript_30473/g.98428  ORF Transcript_30473/g.98428 Transcript_30473/m.98428 type:complete len:274 (-) Transcript_30473:1673-2494(-)|eukprot:scaffold10429_cov122-Isochrysis_galbana.AAC.4